jgi:hypothetical protein
MIWAEIEAFHLQQQRIQKEQQQKHNYNNLEESEMN